MRMTIAVVVALSALLATSAMAQEHGEHSPPAGAPPVVPPASQGDMMAMREMCKGMMASKMAPETMPKEGSGTKGASMSAAGMEKMQKTCAEMMPMAGKMPEGGMKPDGGMKPMGAANANSMPESAKKPMNKMAAPATQTPVVGATGNALCRTRRSVEARCSCLKDTSRIGIARAAADGGKNECFVP